MMKQLFIILLCLFSVKTTFAFWGGDLIYLSQILQKSILQLEQLNKITGVNKDTLKLLKATNRGLHEAIYIGETTNRTLKAGTFSKLRNLNETIHAVKRLYGRIPKTRESELQKKTDLTVAESLVHHKEAFKYASKIDIEAQKMKNYAHRASQVGATKTLLEGQAIMIHTLNQILRTNAALLKIQTQQLALKNKNDKNHSRQFQVQYSELSSAFKNLKPNYQLTSF